MSKWSIGDSSIHGKGVGAARPIKSGEFIDIGIELNFIYFPHVTKFGSLINHQRFASCELVYHKKMYFVVALVDLERGHEITLNYNQCPWFIKDADPSWD
jgi:hypothetical protein